MSSYSEGQTHQLMNALESAGFTPAHITKLGQFDDLVGIRNILDSYFEIRPVEHIIDCDADPFTPSGWKVEEHKKDGKFVWNPSCTQLYLSPNQQNGKAIEGNKLRKELAGKPVLNANVLDYLLAHPHLIPEERKGKYVFFWGTIYRDSDGYLCVRFLFWVGSAWHWSCRWLGSDWCGGGPAALRAS